MIAEHRRADPFGVFVGGFITLIAHGGLIATLFLVNAFGKAEAVEPTVVLPVLSTELLMLGDVMPEDGQLPWIANPEEAPLAEPDRAAVPPPEEETTLPEQEVVDLNAAEQAEEPETENRARPEEHRPDRAERRNRGESNRNRPTNDRSTMGSPDGVAGGTSLSATAMANQLAGITAQLSRALRRPQAIPESEYNSLTAEVEVRCTPSGQITDWDFEERSGNRLFDSAVERMLNRFHMGDDRLRLSTVTNDQLRNSMISRGFTVPIRAR